MIPLPARRLLGLALVACLGWAGIEAAAGPPHPPEPLPPVLSLDEAIGWALRNSPELASVRQQYGIAAAAVVIANTYPFNPMAENRIQASSGPTSAGITNRVPLEHIIVWEIEIHGQGTFRRQEAAAALRRTDWEIAFQEQQLAIRVMRAFVTVLYRQESLRLLEETVRLDKQLVEDVRRLRGGGVLTDADLIVAQSEVDDARALLGTGRTMLTAARADLYRALGAVDGAVEVQGRLEVPPYPEDVAALMQAALERRADLRARQVAVAEAQAALRLAVASRYGNPSIGPAYTYDPTRVNEIGGQINFPLPIVNTHRGEILRSRAQRDLAVLEVRRTEVAVRQDVQAALSRLAAARALAETYRTQTLPNLLNYLQDIEQLFRASKVDLLRIIDLYRKQLRARGGYLDALLEVNLARADLAAAVGEPVVRTVPGGPGACPPSPRP